MDASNIAPSVVHSLAIVEAMCVLLVAIGTVANSKVVNVTSTPILEGVVAKVTASLLVPRYG